MSSYNIIDLQGQSIYSTAEAVKAANLDWEVDSGNVQVQTFNRDECQYQWTNMPNLKGIYRTDTSEPLGNCVVGQGFETVQNTEAFRCFDRILQTSNAQFVSGGYFHNGSSVFLQCRLPYEAKLINGDTTERYLLIAQGHTGQQALSMRFTHIRPVCSNTLYAALRDSNHSFTIKHTRSIQDNMGKAVKFMKLGLNHLAKVEDTFNRFVNMPLSEKEQLNFLKLCYDRPIDEDLKDWRKWNSGIEPIFLDARGKDKSEGTLWHPFNVVTEYEDHWSPVNNPRGQRGAIRSAEVITEARQVRALLNKPTVDRKTKAFTLADDVQAGRIDLRTGKRHEATTGFAAAVASAAVAGAVGQQLMF